MLSAHSQQTLGSMYYYVYASPVVNEIFSLCKRILLKGIRDIACRSQAGENLLLIQLDIPCVIRLDTFYFV